MRKLDIFLEEFRKHFLLYNSVHEMKMVCSQSCVRLCMIIIIWWNDETYSVFYIISIITTNFCAKFDYDDIIL